jgi:hypothetical protein
MDGLTKWLLGITAVAVVSYVALVYGPCALDAHCHLRVCHKYTCGVIYDRDDAQPAR